MLCNISSYELRAIFYLLFLLRPQSFCSNITFLSIDLSTDGEEKLHLNVRLKGLTDVAPQEQAKGLGSNNTPQTLEEKERKQLLADKDSTLLF